MVWLLSFYSLLLYLPFSFSLKIRSWVWRSLTLGRVRRSSLSVVAGLPCLELRFRVPQQAYAYQRKWEEDWWFMTNSA